MPARRNAKASAWYTGRNFPRIRRKLITTPPPITAPTGPTRGITVLAERYSSGFTVWAMAAEIAASRKRLALRASRATAARPYCIGAERFPL